MRPGGVLRQGAARPLGGAGGGGNGAAEGICPGFAGGAGRGQRHGLRQGHGLLRKGKVQIGRHSHDLRLRLGGDGFRHSDPQQGQASLGRQAPAPRRGDSGQRPAAGAAQRADRRDGVRRSEPRGGGLRGEKRGDDDGLVRSGGVQQRLCRPPGLLRGAEGRAAEGASGGDHGGHCLYPGGAGAVPRHGSQPGRAVPRSPWAAERHSAALGDHLQRPCGGEEIRRAGKSRGNRRQCRHHRRAEPEKRPCASAPGAEPSGNPGAGGG